MVVLAGAAAFHERGTPVGLSILKWREGTCVLQYRGTLLIRKRLALGTYSRIMPMARWRS